MKSIVNISFLTQRLFAGSFTAFNKQMNSNSRKSSHCHSMKLIKSNIMTKNFCFHYFYESIGTMLCDVILCLALLCQNRFRFFN